MKDSRSGAMAIVGVFCLLALKIAFVASLDDIRVLPSLVLAAALGRGSMVWLCASSAYARSEGGTASAYIGHVNRQTLLIATFFSAAIAFWLFHVEGLGVMVVAAGFTWIFRRYTERRIGGMTGDTLGACSELVEILILALLNVHGPAFNG
jgi:adenosylcobinamide-GDP ribazoletransferase